MKRNATYFAALLLLGCNLPVFAVDWFAITPLDYRSFGYLSVHSSYRQASKTSTDISSTTSNFGGQIQLDARNHGYIYRPWIARFNMMGSLLVNSRQFNLETREESTLLRSRVAVGFNLFEKSDYPISLKLNKTNSRLSGNDDTEEELHETDLFGSYLFDDDSQLSYSYQGRETDSSLSDRSHSYKNLNLKWNKDGDEHRWLANMTFTNQSLSMLSASESSDYINNSSEYGVYSIGHSYNDGISANFNNQLSYSHTEYQSLYNSNSNNRWQLRSIAMLTDPDDPRIRHTINFLADVADNSIESFITEEEKDIATHRISLDRGVFFKIDDVWTLSANLSLRNNKNGDNKINIGRAFTGIQFRKNWAMSDSADYVFIFDNSAQMSKYSTLQHSSTTFDSSLDHGIRWRKNLNAGYMNISLSQQLSGRHSNQVVNESVENRANSYTHQLQFNWSSNDLNSNTMLSLDLSDTQYWNDKNANYQQANIQLQRNLTTTDTSGWQAGLGGQWTKTYTEVGMENTMHSLNGSVSYSNSYFLGIQNMRISSALSFPISKEEFDDGRRTNNLTQWRTEITYHFGLLQARSEIIMTDDLKYARIELRRAFSIL